MKIIALDIGDVWTGIAISDALGMLARPYQTVKSNSLESFLALLLKEEQIKTIVVGYPKTLRGTESQQTKKVKMKKEKLEQLFADVSWELWDERLTSKQAEALKKATTAEAKKKSHSIAAALILSSYLDYLRIQK